jgi:putative sporulation protein YtaF
VIWLQVLFLAAAVSFDSLAIGISYGMARIEIPFRARVLLSLISGVVFASAMLVGSGVREWLPTAAGNMVSGLLLIIVGAYTLWRANSPTETSQIIKVRIPGLGLIIQVFREPLRADLNNDRRLAIEEAVLLGVTLAFDSLAAGVGAAIIGLPLLETSTAVALVSFLLVSLGLGRGARAAHTIIDKRLHRIPGLLIMSMGVLKILI